MKEGGGRWQRRTVGVRACLVQQQWKLKTIKNVLLTHVDVRKGGGCERKTKEDEAER